MAPSFSRSIFAFIIAGLAKPVVAENRKKRRQLDKLSFKEKDDNKHLLHDHLASRKDKVNELHHRMTAMDETEDLGSSERNPRHVGPVVNTEKDSDRVDFGIFDASSGRKLVVSDDVPSPDSRRLEADDTCRVAGGDECGDGYECTCACDEPNTMKPTPRPPSGPTAPSTEPPTALPIQPPTPPPTPLPTPQTPMSACEMPCTVDTLTELKDAIANAPDIPDQPALISVCSGRFNFDETLDLGNKAFDMCCPGTEECLFEPSAFMNISLFAASSASVDFTMDGFTFQNGYAGSGFGGALSLFNVSGYAQFFNNTFTYNEAYDGGGALFLYGSELEVVLRGNTFDSNRADNGGAVVTFLSTVRFFYNIFTSNEAEINGGALCLINGFSALVGNTFRSNVASGPTYMSDNIYRSPDPTICGPTVGPTGNKFCDGVSWPANLQTRCGAASPVC